MAPHEERVVNERNELAAKLDKLSCFVDAPKPDHVTSIQWSLLIAQRYVMTAYLHILDQRIKNF